MINIQRLSLSLCCGMPICHHGLVVCQNYLRLKLDCSTAQFLHKLKRPGELFNTVKLASNRAPTRNALYNVLTEISANRTNIIVVEIPNGVHVSQDVGMLFSHYLPPYSMKFTVQQPAVSFHILDSHILFVKALSFKVY